MVCTCRPVELLPNTHPLKLISRELVARALWTNVALPPLSTEAVQQIVEQELGTAVCSPSLIVRVAESSGGNPLFIGSIVQRLRNSGDEEAGYQSDGPWEPLSLAPSDDLQGLLLSQFSELDTDGRQVLEYGSVAGSAFSASDVAALSGRRTTEAEAWLERVAGSTTWLRALPGDPSSEPLGPLEFEFKHALYRDVIYRQMGRHRRAIAHRCLAERLENSLNGQVEEHASELAWRYHECGDPEKTGSVAGALHRGWIDLKAAVSAKDEHAVLAECERGEDSAVEEYREALEHSELPPEVHGVIARQYASVQEAHDRVRDLRDSYQK